MIDTQDAPELAALERFNEIINTAEARCMAVDGPVTPTLQEMEEGELAELWRCAQSLSRLAERVKEAEWGFGHENRMKCDAIKDARKWRILHDERDAECERQWARADAAEKALATIAEGMTYIKQPNRLAAAVALAKNTLPSSALTAIQSIGDENAAE